MNFCCARNIVSCAALMGLSLARLGAATFSVNLTDDPAALAASVLGPGISLTGTPALSSVSGQSGIFTDFNSGVFTQTGGNSAMFSVASGIILTTGIASGAEGNYIGGPSFDASGPGDAALSSLSGSPTFDANRLTFQFLAANPVLTLNFLFASSEYPSFVGSSPTDPFAIFVNGVNVAFVPGTTTPVSINSINASTNSNFFTQYSTPATPFNYGGVTTLLTANAAVSTSSVNTITFAIADAVDGSLDSAVLIRGGSVSSVPEPSTVSLIATGAGLLFAFIRIRRKLNSNI